MQYLTLQDRPDFQKANALLDCYNRMGIPFDKQVLDERLEAIPLEMQQLERQIYELAGCTFKITSPAQFARVLVNQFGVSEKELKLPSGNLSVNEKITRNLKKKYTLPILDLVAKYKNLNIQRNNINGDKGIFKYMQPSNMVSEEGHPIWFVVPQISLLETGRYQFSNPAIGSITPEILKTMTAPKGYSIITIDIAQEEPTILFNGVLNSPCIRKLFAFYKEDKYIAITKFCLAQEEALEKILAFANNKGSSITPDDWVYPFLLKNALNGTVMYYKKKPIINYDYLNRYIMSNTIHDVQYSEDDRQGYKVALLSGSYGAYQTTLQAKAGEKIGASFYRMLNTLPEMVEYRDRASQYLKTGGRTVLTMFGTRLKLKEYDKNGEARNHEELLRLMVNYPTQGTGADLLKFIICSLYDWVKSKGLVPNDCRLITPRHDEVVILIKDELLYLADELKGLLEFQIEDWSPIYAKMAIGKTYMKA